MPAGEPLTSLVAGMYLLLSRKDRPMSDALSGIAAVGLTAGLGYVLLSGTGLGGV